MIMKHSNNSYNREETIKALAAEVGIEEKEYEQIQRRVDTLHRNRNVGIDYALEIESFCKMYTIKFVSNYRGRNEKGLDCVGIVCKNTSKTLLKMQIEFGKRGIQICDDLDYVEVDKYGNSNILYFPRIRMR